MSERKDPFRTLDDPDPRPAEIPVDGITAEQIQAGSPLVVARTLRDLGFWDLPAGRPSWLRRFIVWLLLGWKWKRIR